MEINKDILRKVIMGEQLNEDEVRGYLKYDLPLTPHIKSEAERMNMIKKSIERDVTLTTVNAEKIPQPTKETTNENYRANVRTAIKETAEKILEDLQALAEHTIRVTSSDHNGTENLLIKNNVTSLNTLYVVDISTRRRNWIENICKDALNNWSWMVKRDLLPSKKHWDNNEEKKSYLKAIVDEYSIMFEDKLRNRQNEDESTLRSLYIKFAEPSDFKAFDRDALGEWFSNREESPEKKAKKVWIKPDHNHSIEDISRIMGEWGYIVSEPVSLADGEFAIELKGVSTFSTRKSNELKSLDGQEDLMSVDSAEEFLVEYGRIKVNLNDVPNTLVNDLPYFKESDLCKYLKETLTIAIKNLDA